MLENKIWQEPNFILPKTNYQNIKDFIIKRSKDYEIFINPRIISKSKLQQFDYEICSSFPLYFYNKIFF